MTARAEAFCLPENVFKKSLMTIRVFLIFGLFGLAGTASWVNPAHAQSLKQLNDLKSPFVLAPLPFAYEALEPVIDQETMKIHHGKHHQAYVDNLNKALGDSPESKMSLGALLAGISKHSETIRNNAGGHWNHSFFWSILSGKASEQKMPSRLKKEIEKQFGSVEAFKEAFEKRGTLQFGSGWVWLIRNGEGKLEISSTPNQDNPLMDVAFTKGKPILGVDVWEHAYYLKYQNRRGEYLKQIWGVVNWKRVNDLDSSL